LGKPPPHQQFPSPPPAEEWIHEKDKEKLWTLVQKRNLVPGPVWTVVPRFAVKKGADDIQVVWDLKKNGLNACIYTPSFFLYTPSSYARRVEAGTYGSDADVEEQFHNFLLHKSEQAYCGVELPRDLVEELKLEKTLEGSPLEVQRFM